MTTGIYLTHLLKRYAIECVFGIPGVHTLELYRALNDADIRHISPRHEQGAGFMADGYARVSGKPGVCFIISGPGMTNIVTAMGQAYADSIPMLVLSTVNSHGRMGSGDGWLHELQDQQGLVKGVCEFSHTVHHASELPSVLARAFAVFTGSRPRPVHIELPINVLLSDAQHVLLQASLRAPSQTRLNGHVSLVARPCGNAGQISQAAKLINGASMPVILAGGGAVNAATAVQKMAEQINAPVVMTVNARGILASDHSLAVGASASLASVRTLIKSADVVVALGTEFGSTDYDVYEDGQFAIPGQLVRIDIDHQQLMRTIIPDIGIVGDTGETVTALLTQLNQTPHSNAGPSRASECMQQTLESLSAREHRYLSLLNTIRDTLPDAPIVGDSMQVTYAGNSAFCANKPGHYFNSATGFGTLGYGLPAAIGAAIAQPDKPVVAIVGDGGLQFSLSELATAVDAQSNLILIIHENGGYAEIKHFMVAEQIEPVGVDLLVPDIKMLAKACRWHTEQVESLQGLSSLLKASAMAKHPVLLLIDDTVFDEC